MLSDLAQAVALTTRPNLDRMVDVAQQVIVAYIHSKDLFLKIWLMFYTNSPIKFPHHIPVDSEDMFDKWLTFHIALESSSHIHSEDFVSSPGGQVKRCGWG